MLSIKNLKNEFFCIDIELISGFSIDHVRLTSDVSWDHWTSSYCQICHFFLYESLLWSRKMFLTPLKEEQPKSDPCCSYWLLMSQKCKRSKNKKYLCTKRLSETNQTFSLHSKLYLLYYIHISISMESCQNKCPNYFIIRVLYFTFFSLFMLLKK